MPSGYRGPASSAGYLRSPMKGICVAVKATTSVAGSSRYTTLKLWKSLPAAPMMSTRLVIPSLSPSRQCGLRAEQGGAYGRPPGASKMRRLGSVAAGPVQPDGVLQALQLDESDVDESYGRVPRGSHDAVTDQDLPGPSIRGDPRGDVHRPAEVVAVLEDHRPRIYARMGRRKASGRYAIGQ